MNWRRAKVRCDSLNGRNKNVQRAMLQVQRINLICLVVVVFFLLHHYKSIDVDYLMFIYYLSLVRNVVDSLIMPFCLFKWRDSVRKLNI